MLTGNFERTRQALGTEYEFGPAELTLERTLY
jgi:hypothetical protein